MSKNSKGARFVFKHSIIHNTIPTIPLNNSVDHTEGWLDTDIYVGELYFNLVDDKMWFRDKMDKMIEICTLSPNGFIKKENLPDNFIGKMEYKGIWKIIDEQLPMGDYFNKGDYFVISECGINSMWSVGNIIIYNGELWDKIDLIKTDISSSNITYTNMKFPSVKNSKDVFDLILNNQTNYIGDNNITAGNGADGEDTSGNGGDVNITPGNGGYNLNGGIEGGNVGEINLSGATNISDDLTFINTSDITIKLADMTTNGNAPKLSILGSDSLNSSGGDIDITSGSGDIGGSLNIVTGDGDEGSGDVNITTGDSEDDAGSFIFNGGVSSANTGGQFNATGGKGENHGGNIVLTGGEGYVNGGNIVLTGGAAEGDNGEIFLNSNVIAGNINGEVVGTSDIRLKKNIETLDSSLSKILLLRSVSFDWKHKENPTKSYGYIAQELEEIFPDSVVESRVSQEDTELYKHIKYIDIIPHITSAIQDQNNTIQNLKNEDIQYQSVITNGECIIPTIQKYNILKVESTSSVINIDLNIFEKLNHPFEVNLMLNNTVIKNEKYCVIIISGNDILTAYNVNNSSNKYIKCTWNGGTTEFTEGGWWCTYIKNETYSQ